MSSSEPDVPHVGPYRKEINWLVDKFVQETPGVAHAVVITEDGLLMAVSDRLRRDRAEQIAAVTAGMASLVVGAAKAIAGGEVRQTVVEMEYGVMLLLAVADGSCLAVLAAADADLGLVGYEASMLVRRVGAVITPGPRSAPSDRPRKQPDPPAPDAPVDDWDEPSEPPHETGPGTEPETVPDTGPEPPDPPSVRPAGPPEPDQSGIGPESVSVRPSDPRPGRGGRRQPPEGSGPTQSSVRPVERAPRQRHGRRPRR